MTRQRPEVLRRLVLTVGVGAALFGQMQAPVFASADSGGRGDACAAERAPLVERQKQYQAIHHSHLGAALAKGLEAGAMFAASQMLGRVLPGPFSLGGGGGHGGGSGMGSTFFSPGNLSEASKLSIPGVSGGGGFGSSDARAIAAMAVVVAVVSTVEAYAQLKEEEAGGDRIKLANSIDDDARRQAEVTRSIAADEAALDACRTRQVSEYKVKLSSANNDQDRRNLARDRSSLQGIIKNDEDLESGVVEQQASLAKTYTQSRAMSENTSEAAVLGGQAPAYAPTASTAPLKLPPPAKGAAAKPGAAGAASTTPSGPLKRGGGVMTTSTPAPPPAPVYTASRALTVRATASARAKIVGNLAAGATVQVADNAGAPAGWSQVSVNGASGYVQTAMLTKSTPVNAGPRLSPPSNIRDHNRAVIAAREQGPNRLKTLLTDVQAG